MDFVFDQLDTTTCAGCGGVVDVTDIQAFKVLPCPHCKAEVRVPGKLGTLLLQEVVGVGSAGIVYRALDATLHRHVAVKILKNEEGDDKKNVQATVAEARALAAINHPNVVHIHTIGMRHGQPFIVMELLLGSGKLNVMIKEGWVADEKRGLEIALDVAQGLRAAQSAGLLHRDVKPGNILFNNEGVAKLLDFSVVHAATGDGEKVVIGTPYYISPEAARGNDVDFRTDIYSLGATVYHLMTGQPVFDGESSRDVMRARLKQRAPDVRQLKPGVSAMAAGILARMLETDPADRYASYDELIADVRLALDQLVHGAPPDIGGIGDFDQMMSLGGDTVPVATPRRTRMPAPQPAEGKSSRGMMIALAAAGIAIVAGVAIFLAMSGGGKDTPKKDGDRLATTDRTHTPTATDGGSTAKPPSTTDRWTPTPDPTTDAKKVDPPVPPVTPDPPKENPVLVAMKAWEQEVAVNLTREPPAWQPIKWTATQSAGGATLTVQPDGAVLVTGGNPATDTYVLEMKLDTPPEQITGLLLEALPDPSLPMGGPGRSTTGNFVLAGVAAQVVSAANPRAVRAFVFGSASEEYAQANFHFASVIDADPQTGWAISPRFNRATAALLPVKGLPAASAAPKRPSVVFDDFEGAKFSDKWTVTGNAFKDRPYKDGDIVFASGLSGFAGKQMINSALGTGLGVNNPDNKRGTGTLASKPFKIERDTLSFLVAGGDKETTRVQLKVGGNVVLKATGDRSLKLKKIEWNVRPYADKEATLEIIDEEDKDNRGFIVVDQIEFTDDAAGPAAAGDGAILRVTLSHVATFHQHTLGKFRVSLTTAKDPFLSPKLPDNIKSIVAAGPQGRSVAQASELEAFFRRTKVEGLQYIPPGGVALVPDPATPVTPTKVPDPVKPVTPTNVEPPPKLDPYKPIDLAKLPDKRTYDAPADSLVLVPRASQWLYWAKSEAPEAKWAAADFVANGWALEEAGFGYGAYETRTMLKDMKGKFAVLYVRAPFQIDDPAKLGDLSLLGRFDDAFAVYINGHAVYRSPALSGAGAAAKVTQSIAKSGVVSLPLKDAKKALKAGINVIAIECHNAAIDDGDFMLDPALIAEAPVVPRQPAVANKREGWTAVDGKMSFDNAGIYIDGTGADPRIETGEIKTDFDDRAGTVKIVIKIKVENAVALKLDWKTKPKNQQNPLGYSETENVGANPQLRQITLDKIRVTGKLQNLVIHLPKGTTQIQSIHVLNEKDNKVRDAWVFGKD